MSYVSHLRCTGCDTVYPADTVMNLCQKDNRPVEIIIDTDRLAKERPDYSWYRPDVNNMWRFGGLMPFDNTDGSELDKIISLGEGHTPLIPLHDLEPVKKMGFELYLKDEGRPWPGYGCNPTGSFKDRGMSVVVSMAKSLGLDRLAVPTQGNAGDSLTEYALHAGFEIAVAMPDDTPMPILGRVAAMEKLHTSIHLELVKGTIREANELLRKKYIPEGYFSVATFQEPGWRIEGKKTLGLELAEPDNGMNREWSLPMSFYIPPVEAPGFWGCGRHLMNWRR